MREGRGILMLLSVLVAAAATAQAAVSQPAVVGSAAPVVNAAPAAQHVAESQGVAPSVVQSINHGIALWRNIEDGMSVTQLRAAYPQGPTVAYKDDRTVLADVPVIEGCQAKVNVMHPGGVVREIVMRGEGAIA